MAGMTLNSIDIVDPDLFVQRGYPHEEWALLRREAPVYWYQRENIHPPFWAITKHADLLEVSRRPDLFNSVPPDRPLFVFKKNPDQPRSEEPVFHTLLTMNPPQHGAYRAVVNKRFTPHAIGKLREQIEEVTAAVLDEVVDRSECDFVTEVAARLPLAVISEMFGIPRQDWDRMFRLSNEMIAAEDEEFHRTESIKENVERARLDFFEYFSGLIADRQKTPRDDLSTALTHAQVNGQPMPLFEQLSYFALLIIAGNETTRNAISGGLYALMQHPEQWQRLRGDLGLIPTATEEILRWVSPVVQFTRIASRDTVLRGQQIHAGDFLALFYPSANRDEEVFAEPFRFDITRNPNPQLAFGIGEHYCLGANLARLELQIMFRQLMERLDYAEMTGPIQRMRSNFVGGIKHMPVRLRIRPRRAAA
ncbi:MAG TPA: cytochrome P450 [Candidatus Binataceae bacterium]|jgi:cholest-4-en-3-one 26-monooxygenase|nr:cytochrome P450 [Candidatus Binataceae bacterium]